MIFQQQIYADDEGRVIHAKIPINTFAQSTFFGIDFIEESPGDMLQVDFEVPGEGIEHAFSNFDTAHKSAMDDARVKIAKQKEFRQAAAKPKIQRATADVLRRL